MHSLSRRQDKDFLYQHGNANKITRSCLREMKHLNKDTSCRVDET